METEASKVAAFTETEASRVEAFVEAAFMETEASRVEAFAEAAFTETEASKVEAVASTAAAVFMVAVAGEAVATKMREFLGDSKRGAKAPRFLLI